VRARVRARVCPRSWFCACSNSGSRQSVLASAPSYKDRKSGRWIEKRADETPWRELHGASSYRLAEHAANILVAELRVTELPESQLTMPVTSVPPGFRRSSTLFTVWLGWE